MFLELLAAFLVGTDNTESTFYSPYQRGDTEEFEEADSFFDSDGNEHIVDDDGYCEDCDDYHDDF